ncbi:protein disulfide isomerase CRELD1 isoform X2 [Sphaerodactylus townsendi]|uniref:protein disulfide isomerase CRELD1 isoform X2 n=1 Tax=Sphaerodactylus townsendi TaxID=933632 RepID=UPI002026B679|nr:protein disulfide isomerase CRELD1 isoform X2 [Sphaerodactylus townsendi]
MLTPLGPGCSSCLVRRLELRLRPVVWKRNPTESGGTSFLASVQRNAASYRIAACKELQLVNSLLAGMKMALPWLRALPPPFLFLLLFLWIPGPGTPQKEPCQTCQDLTSNFNKGLERTQRENFGGGNTAWEEEKLAKYANSETRLLEVLEGVCATSDFACHQLLEKSEEHVERWWFHEQQQHPDFSQWLCMDTLKLCCSPGTYGPDCHTCPGGTQKPCSGYGQCDGDGTRGGTGLCMCQTGYGGPYCSECGDGYYQAARNDSHLSATGPVDAALDLKTQAVSAAREVG